MNDSHDLRPTFATLDQAVAAAEAALRRGVELAAYACGRCKRFHTAPWPTTHGSPYARSFAPRCDASYVSKTTTGVRRCTRELDHVPPGAHDDAHFPPGFVRDLTAETATIAPDPFAGLELEDDTGDEFDGLELDE